MKEKKNKKNEEQRDNKPLLLVLLLLLVVVSVIGIGYAVFNFASKGTKINSITTGAVTMIYNEGTNKISIADAIPMEDSVGMKLSDTDQVFDFTIDIHIIGSSTDIAYEVTADKQDDSTLADNEVRIYLEKSEDATNYSAVANPSGYVPLSAEDAFGAQAGEMVLDVNSTNKSVKYYYKLRMWVAKNYELSDVSKQFTIKINAYGKDGKVDRPVSPDTSGTNPPELVEN